jgi:hypothetical protein
MSDDRMNCDDRAELAPLFLSGELDEARTAAFQSHLSACASCAREMEQHAEIDARLRSEILREPVETAALEARILSRIGRERTIRWAAIAAGVTAMLLGSALLYQSRERARLLDDAAQDHHREVVDREARRWVAEEGAVPELAGRAGLNTTAVSAVDAFFQPAGYHFERAKLCRLGRSRFLHLVFSDGAREVSLFLGSPDSPRPGRIDCADHGNDHVAAFGDSTVRALIVTDQPGDAALRLARSAASVL